MRNRDMPAAPQDENQYGGPAYIFCGLTKREAAAIAAAQGMLGNPDERIDVLNTMAILREQGIIMSMSEVVADRSVEQADALFDELEKGGDDDQE